MLNFHYKFVYSFFIAINFFVFFSNAYFNETQLFQFAGQQQFPQMLQDIQSALNQYQFMDPPQQLKSFCADINVSFSQNKFMKSGYLVVDNTKSNSSLYYTFYGAQNTTDIYSQPLLIYLAGGPGTQGPLLQDVLDVGPFTIIKTPQQNSTTNNSNTTEQFEIVEQQFNWNKYNLLFLSEMVGVGYSYAQRLSDIPTNQDEFALQAYLALQQFFALEEPCFAPFNSTDIYIFGVSYGGKFAPSLASIIIQKNAEIKNTIDYPNPFIELNLKGVILADGWVNPVNITSQYADILFQSGIIDYSTFLQKKQQFDEFLAYYYNTTAQQSDPEYSAKLLNYNLNVMDYGPNNNMYDIRLTNQQYNDLFNVEDQTLSDFLTKDNGLEKFNVYNFVQDHNNANLIMILYSFSGDFLANTQQHVEFLLNSNIPFLVWVGQDDFIVNAPGTEMWMNNLNWDQIVQFNAQPLQEWINSSSQNIKGYTKELSLLKYALVNKAGHGALILQPENCQELLYNFIDSHSNINSNQINQN